MNKIKTKAKSLAFNETIPQTMAKTIVVGLQKVDEWASTRPIEGFYTWIRDCLNVYT